MILSMLRMYRAELIRRKNPLAITTGGFTVQIFYLFMSETAESAAIFPVTIP